VIAAGVAESSLGEMQERIADRLGTGSICMVKLQRGIRQRPAAAIITVGLATALFVSALIYAVVH
jgi:hypothetical protein